ncbi:hypothetical protein C3747_161g24 [Trypanosoma cruzi]|nr:hypothetical protein C3747_161g24 [Trypanosoma cruzi]
MVFPAQFIFIFICFVFFLLLLFLVRFFNLIRCLFGWGKGEREGRGGERREGKKMFGLTRWLRVKITVEQVAAVVQAKLSGAQSVQNTLLIDVRSTGEVAATGVIPTAVNVPLKLLEFALGEEVEAEEFEKTFGVQKPQPGMTQVIFYCTHGVRSAIATEIAGNLGFTDAKNFAGSFTEWQRHHGEPCDNRDVPLK